MSDIKPADPGSILSAFEAQRGVNIDPALPYRAKLEQYLPAIGIDVGRGWRNYKLTSGQLHALICEIERQSAVRRSSN